MSDSREETLLGRIALQANLITVEQLAEATREQGRLGGTRNLGDVFVERGFLTPEELQRLIQLQKNVIARLAERNARAAAEPAAPPAHAPPPRPRGVPAEPPQKSPFGLEARIARLATQRHAGDSPRETLSAPVSGALAELLQRSLVAGASDVHVHSGARLHFRVLGALVEQPGGVLEADRAESLVLEGLRPDERKQLAAKGEIDFCLELAGVGRFRGNAYRQQRGVDATFRWIPAEIPTFAQLSLPNTLARLTNYHQGMVLVTGPARCGKTSTMASLVNLVNEERSGHILTIEDPIEFLHPSKRSLVNQRNVHRHTTSFARALRGALREDPDVIVIGELRDAETISLALTAAETGHLVLATLHTDSAIRTLDRLVGAFPPVQQEQVRTMMSESLRAVISQRLLPSADGTRLLPALEVLVVNRAVGKLIRDEKTFQIHSILQTGSAQGMCLLDHSLAMLVASGAVKRDDALRHCSSPKALVGA